MNNDRETGTSGNQLEALSRISADGSVRPAKELFLHGLDPSVIIESKEGNKGSRVYLCVSRKDEGDKYFVVKASELMDERDAFREYRE
jgi:hypothetical protein